jgi:membrane protein
VRGDADRSDAAPGDDAPGRDALHPRELPPRAWGQVARRVWQGITLHHLSLVSAGVAFFGVIAIFPAIAALIALYGLVADPQQVAETLAAVRPLVPGDVFAMIAGQVDALVAAPSSKLGLASLVSFALLLWTARAGVSALMEGLNVVYREIDERGLFMQYAISLGLTFALLVAIAIALLAVVAVPAALPFTDLGAVGRFLARWVPFAILAAATVLLIGALYRYGPHRALARKRWITIGAVVASVGWLMVSLALSAYFSHFPNLNKTYGSLGAIVAMLFWAYASAFAVLLGAELNAALELQTAKDTTTGPPEPMGERGAWVADHVA